MSTLDAYARFLTARWDEIEKAAQSVPPLGHNYDMGGNRQGEVFTFGRRLPSSMDGRGNVSEYRDSPTTAAHFALHDPRAVLADIAAKRVILDDAHRAEQAAATMRAESFKASFHAMLVVVRTLAEPFRDHPNHPANQET